MIFVTVGTQKFPFTRLFKELDDLKENGHIDDEIVAQIGFTKYTPRCYKSFAMLASDEMKDYLAKCEFVITHAGTSTIIQCLKLGKKVIVVPRRKTFGEHVDDHQMEIADLFGYKNMVEVVYDIKDLREGLERLKVSTYSGYEFKNEHLLESLKEVIGNAVGQ